MPLRTCAVTLTDARGVKHTAEVTAETLYEAAILGIQILKKDGWIEGAVGAATRIEIEVREPAMTHTVTMIQIERWLSGATISRNEQKDRVRDAADGEVAMSDWVP